jgi:hypothetical protein
MCIVWIKYVRTFKTVHYEGIRQPNRLVTYLEHMPDVLLTLFCEFFAFFSRGNVFSLQLYRHAVYKCKYANKILKIYVHAILNDEWMYNYV